MAWGSWRHMLFDVIHLISWAPSCLLPLAPQSSHKYSHCAAVLQMGCSLPLSSWPPTLAPDPSIPQHRSSGKCFSKNHTPHPQQHYRSITCYSFSLHNHNYHCTNKNVQIPALNIESSLNTVRSHLRGAEHLTLSSLRLLVSWSLPPCPPTRCTHSFLSFATSCLAQHHCLHEIMTIWAPFDISVSSTSQQVLALASLFPSS